MKTDSTLQYRDAYESLFLHNPGAVFSIDLDGKFLSFNPASERISGYSEKNSVISEASGTYWLPMKCQMLRNIFAKLWRVMRNILGLRLKVNHASTI